MGSDEEPPVGPTDEELEAGFYGFDINKEEDEVEQPLNQVEEQIDIEEEEDKDEDPPAEGGLIVSSDSEMEELPPLKSEEEILKKKESIESRKKKSTIVADPVKNKKEGISGFEIFIHICDFGEMAIFAICIWILNFLIENFVVIMHIEFSD